MILSLSRELQKEDSQDNILQWRLDDEVMAGIYPISWLKSAVKARWSSEPFISPPTLTLTLG